MGKSERQALVVFSIILWAMSSVLYAHLHHWSLFDEKGAFIKSSTVDSQTRSLSNEQQTDLLEQISKLEQKQEALTNAFSHYHTDQALPSPSELKSLGITLSVVDAYQNAKSASSSSSSSVASSVVTIIPNEVVAPLHEEFQVVKQQTIVFPKKEVQIAPPPPPEHHPLPPPPAPAPKVAANPIDKSQSNEDLGSLIAAQGGHHRRLANRGSSVVVVGGSDGSGTRSVVATLEKLGVFMVVDDRGTNDVHAAEMGGWPPVVSPVLNSVKAADYELNKVSRNIREGTMNKMSRFIDSMKRQGTNGHNKLLKRKDGGEKVKVASGVSYGYKAPVSMLLVPFLRDIYAKSGFKFLQVVRDGRDIAFSGNQSPVTKFYQDTFSRQDYEKWARLPEVRGIKLWSEWNTDVHEYGTRKNEARDADFEHLTIHTEDLIDPNPNVKFETIREIAGFVGANDFTNDELCCMVIAPEEFMGSHAKEVHGRGEQGSAASNQLKKRFGHWHAKLEGKPELSRAMHEQGARGLKVFGYEPEVERSYEPVDGYHCTLTMQQCSERGIAVKTGRSGGGKAQPKSRGSSEAVDSARCTFDKGKDYYGPESKDIVAVHTPDAAGCCEDCHSHQGCAYFTYDPDQSLCFLKGAMGSQRSTNGLISGNIK